MLEIFKSVLEQDRAPIVICDLEHKIIYMNPSSTERYGKYGGKALLGRSLLECHNESSRKAIKKVIAWFFENKNNNIVFTSRNDEENKDVYMVALRDSNGALIGYYEKHEYRSSETAELYSEVK